MKATTYDEILEWHYCGRVNNLCQIAAEIKGVYLWVYKNSRVVYVGTSFESNGISQRINKHVKDSRKGLCTIFAPKKGQDVYDIMSYPKEKIFYKTKMIEHLKDLSKERLIWVPNKKLPSLRYPKFFYRDHFLQKDDYKENWLETGVVDKYLSCCDVWACNMQESNSKFLENQLQVSFGNYTCNQMIYIPSEKYQRNQNWLGKQEKRKETATIEKSFGFKNYPLIGDKEKSVFDNLQDLTRVNIDKQWFNKLE